MDQSKSNESSSKRRRRNLTPEEKVLIKNVFEGLRLRDKSLSITDAALLCSSLTKVSERTVYRAIKSEEVQPKKEKLKKENPKKKGGGRNKANKDESASTSNGTAECRNPTEIVEVKKEVDVGDSNPLEPEIKELDDKNIIHPENIKVEPENTENCISDGTAECRNPIEMVKVKMEIDVGDTFLVNQEDVSNENDEEEKNDDPIFEETRVRKKLPEVTSDGTVESINPIETVKVKMEIDVGNTFLVKLEDISAANEKQVKIDDINFQESREGEQIQEVFQHKNGKAKQNYKYCIVPMCGNTTVSAPNKLFFALPRTKNRTCWQKAMRRYKMVSVASSHYCCEDHFDLKTDMENYCEWKLMGNVNMRLKSNVVPHKFECQGRGKKVSPGRSAFLKREHQRIISQLLETPVPKKIKTDKTTSTAQETK